jgi:hypothetical protein
MIITKTIEVPENRLLTIEVPREIPAGRTTVIIEFPLEKKTPVFGCAKGQFRMSEDFDEPLEDFNEYM